MARALLVDEAESPFRLTTRRIVIAGVLAGIQLFLSFTGIGLIPVPNATGSATLLHVPAILAGVLEGPLVGVLVGAIFGLYSFTHANGPLFADPSVSVLPRLLIGPVAWLVFYGLRRFNVGLAGIVAGVAGSATNTVLVLGIAIMRNLLPWSVVPTVLPQAVMEAILAGIITGALAEAIILYRSGRTTAPEIAPGEEQRY